MGDVLEFRAGAATLVRTLVALARTLVALALTLVAVAEGMSAQVPGQGPFRVPEQHPLYQRFLTPRPERAELLPAGSVEIAWRTTYSNVFEYARGPVTDATFDYERWTNSVEAVWAPRESFEVGVRTAVVTGWGGVLDGLVQWYHARLSLPNGDREDVEDGDFDVTLVTRQDSVISLDAGTHMADPVAWVAVPIVRGRRAVSARASVKLPAGTDAWSSGQADVALQLDARHIFTDWAAYAGAAVGTVNAGEALEPYTPSAALTLHLGVERRLGDGWGALVQLQGSSPFLRDLEDRELDRAPVNLGVGLTGRTASGWIWQAAFTEDIRPDSPAVDFTLDVHLARVLGGSTVDPSRASRLASGCAPGPQGGSQLTPSGPCR